MVQIGDKVRFLNAVGGGIVKSVDRKRNIVQVEEEDGFETPVLMHECVVIEAGENRMAAGYIPGQDKNKSKKEKQAPPMPAFDEEEEEAIQVFETAEGEQLNLFLGWLPEDKTSLQNSGLELHLINDSNYFLLFTLLSKNGNQWQTRYAGRIEPNMKFYIETVAREQLNEMERLCVQYVAFKQKKPFALKNAVSVEVRIDPVKFYKLHSFRQTDYFEEDALLVPIVRNDVPERMLQVSGEELERAMKSKVAADKPARQPIVKHEKSDNSPLEVDLHIHELLDNTAGLSNSDMLEYQLKKVNEVLSEHRMHKGMKIVFIHGKGNGVLRSAVLKELNTKYKNYSYQDASFREYGFGATLVTIR